MEREGNAPRSWEMFNNQLTDRFLHQNYCTLEDAKQFFVEFHKELENKRDGDMIEDSEIQTVQRLIGVIEYFKEEEAKRQSTNHEAQRDVNIADKGAKKNQLDGNDLVASNTTSTVEDSHGEKVLVGPPEWEFAEQNTKDKEMSDSVVAMNYLKASGDVFWFKEDEKLFIQIVMQ